MASTTRILAGLLCGRATGLTPGPSTCHHAQSSSRLIGRRPIPTATPRLQLPPRTQTQPWQRQRQRQQRQQQQRQQQQERRYLSDTSKPPTLGGRKPKEGSGSSLGGWKPKESAKAAAAEDPAEAVSDDRKSPIRSPERASWKADSGTGKDKYDKASLVVDSDGDIAAVEESDVIPETTSSVLAPSGPTPAVAATSSAANTRTCKHKDDCAPTAPADAPSIPSDGNTSDNDVVAAAADESPTPSTAHAHLHEFAPKIVVVGVGGAGTNAVNNMVASGLKGVEFLALNTDAQHLSKSISPTRLQIGTHLTSGLGCGANPDAGRLAAEESSEAIQSCIEDSHMVFITAGMGGGTGTGAAPAVARLCYELGILTVSVVTTPFRFEGTHRKRLATEGVERLKEVSDTLIVVPNQNLFRLVGENTSFVDSFRLADDVLLAGVRSITDLMTTPGLINLDFADVQSVMHGMGSALLGTGQSCNDDANGSYGIGKTGGISSKCSDAKKETKDDNDENKEPSTENNDECRAIRAAKMALNNPLLGEGNMDVRSAKGMLVNMSGGSDMTLYEVDRAAGYITERVMDPDANIIFGSAYDANLTGCVRVSVVATGIEEDE